MKEYLHIEYLYKLYVCIRKSGFPHRKQYNLLRSLLVGEEWSWRVVGISENALTKFAENDFKIPKNKIERHHHRQSFADTARPMLEGKVIMPKNEWCDQIIENEEVCLVTKEEHDANAFSRIIPIEFEKGLFRNNQSVGYRYGKEEKEHLRQLAQNHGS